MQDIKESGIKEINYDVVQKIKKAINGKLEEAIQHMELMSLWEDASSEEEIDPPMIDYRRIRKEPVSTSMDVFLKTLDTTSHKPANHLDL